MINNLYSDFFFIKLVFRALYKTRAIIIKCIIDNDKNLIIVSGKSVEVLDFCSFVFGCLYILKL